MPSPDPKTHCSLCGRTPIPTERHHLEPERRADSDVILICSPCHRQLHALFTNEELRESYDTAAKLRGAERMQGYYDWIRKTDKTEIQVRTSGHVRERR